MAKRQTVCIGLYALSGVHAWHLPFVPPASLARTLVWRAGGGGMGDGQTNSGRRYCYPEVTLVRPAVHRMVTRTMPLPSGTMREVVEAHPPFPTPDRDHVLCVHGSIVHVGWLAATRIR